MQNSSYIELKPLTHESDLNSQDLVSGMIFGISASKLSPEWFFRAYSHPSKWIWQCIIPGSHSSLLGYDILV